MESEFVGRGVEQTCLRQSEEGQWLLLVEAELKNSL